MLKSVVPVCNHQLVMNGYDCWMCRVRFYQITNVGPSTQKLHRLSGRRWNAKITFNFTTPYTRMLRETVKDIRDAIRARKCVFSICWKTLFLSPYIEMRGLVWTYSFISNNVEDILRVNIIWARCTANRKHFYVSSYEVTHDVVRCNKVF